MKSIMLAIAMMVLTLSAHAQEATSAMAPMIRAFKAQTAAAQATTQPVGSFWCPTPTEPCPYPTPSPSPSPSPLPSTGVTVTGTVVDTEDSAITGAYVLVSWLASSGSREYFPPVTTDSTGTFTALNEYSEPPMGTELLVQATAFAQSPGEGQFQVSTATVEATGGFNDAGRITVKHQMQNIWLEAVASGNNVFIRVRRGSTFPGRDLISLVQTSVPARTSFYRTDVQVQQPFMSQRRGRGASNDGPQWMLFRIPARSPAGSGVCGNVQVSSVVDPSVVHSSEHGFCYNPAFGEIVTW